jgi:hypothetical protein
MKTFAYSSLGEFWGFRKEKSGLEGLFIMKIGRERGKGRLRAAMTHSVLLSSACLVKRICELIGVWFFECLIALDWGVLREVGYRLPKSCTWGGGLMRFGDCRLLWGRVWGSEYLFENKDFELKCFIIWRRHDIIVYGR